MTLSRSERAVRRLQAALDARTVWSLEADLRDVVSGFAGVSEENAALRARINAARSVARHLREEAEQPRYAMYESAYTTAAEWLEAALDGGEPS